MKTFKQVSRDANKWKTIALQRQNFTSFFHQLVIKVNEVWVCFNIVDMFQDILFAVETLRSVKS